MIKSRKGEVHIHQGDSSIVSFGEGSSNYTTKDVDIRPSKHQTRATDQDDVQDDDKVMKSLRLILTTVSLFLVLQMLRKPEVQLGQAPSSKASIVARHF